jgi:hypothetical protein
MKTIWWWIVICTIFGITYYAADKVLANVEATIEATVTTNLLVARRHIDASWLTWALIASGKTLWQAMSWDELSLTKNVSGTDNWTLKDY